VIDSLMSRLRDPHDELALRFQQFTSAVMAKGVEDTAYYRYNRLGRSPRSAQTRPRSARRWRDSMRPRRNGWRTRRAG
jgi:(1->4)-alpha-D-glucan 1-alpha-D-glucosylmutase